MSSINRVAAGEFCDCIYSRSSGMSRKRERWKNVIQKYKSTSVFFRVLENILFVAHVEKSQVENSKSREPKICEKDFSSRENLAAKWLEFGWLQSESTEDENRFFFFSFLSFFDFLFTAASCWMSAKTRRKEIWILPTSLNTHTTNPSRAVDRFVNEIEKQRRKFCIFSSNLWFF